MNGLIYYIEQSKYSSPGKYSNYFDNLPELIKEISEIVHGLIVHQEDTEEFYKFKIPDNKKLQPNTRYIENILETIIANDNRPLSIKRKPQDRFIGTCRDFALLTCSILRHKKIPARVRCGFADYFHDDWYSDHWVCEYFDKKDSKWKLVDSELGQGEKQKYKIDFEITNIPRDRFIVAGKAWLMALRNKINPDILGVKEIKVKGYWFIKADVVRDLAALNRIELLPWDYTEYIDDPFKNIGDRSGDEIELISNIAAITSKEEINLDEALRIYKKNKNLQILKMIKSYSLKGPIDIQI